MNLFIESIEGGTYVAGVGDKQATEYLRDEYRDSMQFQSIAEIREQLSGRNFDKVWLRQNTPYDEMCGTDTHDDKLVIELEWR
ncbi:DUF6482 family protein [Glaciecola siphonariae]|uniref:DUF6482 family protein n=1 Tax=Glaciecola siphonariae TaxID=521012 RepID=A0ABV9LYU6_9ALTE